MELYSIRVYKDGKKYLDFYLVWTYKGKVWFERVMPCFLKTVNTRIVRARSVKVNSIDEMKKDFVARYGFQGDEFQLSKE